MSTNVDVGFLTKLHEEDGSSIVDGGQLPYWIQVEHHDVGKASQIWSKGDGVETLSFPSATNIVLYRFYGDHSVLVRNEIVMI